MVHNRNSTRVNTFTLTYDLMEQIGDDDKLRVANVRGTALLLSKSEVRDAWEQGTSSCTKNGVLVRVIKFPWAS